MDNYINEIYSVDDLNEDTESEETLDEVNSVEEEIIDDTEELTSEEHIENIEEDTESEETLDEVTDNNLDSTLKNDKSLRERAIHPSLFRTAKIAQNMSDTLKADEQGYKTLKGYRVGKAADTFNSIASKMAHIAPGQRLIDNSVIDNATHTFDESYALKHPEEEFDFRTPSNESQEVLESHSLQVPMETQTYETDESVFSNGKKEYKSIIDVTPKNNGKWVDEYGNEGIRGESKWCPDDEYTKEVLKKFGVDGIEYKNGYPNFESVSFFGCTLEPKEFYNSDRVQFDDCNFTLLDEIDDDPELAKLYNFDADQMDDLENGKTPYGYTWHHDTLEEGRLLLVPTAIHQTCRHSGGRSSWGGGSKNR